MNTYKNQPTFLGKYFFPYIFPFLFGVGACVVYHAFIAGPPVAPPPNSGCDAPTGLKILATDATSAKLIWRRVAGAENYVVKLRDSLQNNNIILITGTTDTVITLTGLSANRKYSAEVSTVCKGRNGDQEISPTGSVLKFDSGGTIDIVDGIPHYTPQGTGCPDCNTPVPVTGNCFNWGSGDRVYQATITDKTNNIMVLAYIRKEVLSDGKIRVHCYTTAPCNSPAIVNGPTEANCTPPDNNVRMCGSFAVGGTNHPYEFQGYTTGMCLTFGLVGDASNYVLTVKECQISAARIEK